MLPENIKAIYRAEPKLLQKKDALYVAIQKLMKSFVLDDSLNESLSDGDDGSVEGETKSLTPSEREAESERRDERVKRIYIYNEGFNLIWTGTALTIAPSVMPGVKFNVVSSGPGWYDTAPGKGVREQFVGPSIIHYQVLGFEYDKVQYKPMSFVVFTPLFNALQKQFPVDQSKPHHLSSSIAYAHKHFPFETQIPSAMIESTVRAFMYYTHERLSHLTGSTLIQRILTNNLEVLGLAEPVVERNSTTLGVNLDCREVQQLLADYDVTFPDWDLGDDFRIIKIRGCRFTLNPKILPVFDTPGNDRSRHHRTRFFRFVGTRQTYFVDYDINGHHVCAGMKRVLAKLPTTKFLDDQQYLLGDHFDRFLSTNFDQILYHSDVMLSQHRIYHMLWNLSIEKRVNKSFVRWSPLKSMGLLPYAGFNYFEALDFISVRLSAWIALCNFGKLQYLMDTVHTIKTWGYYTVALGYYSLADLFTVRNMVSLLPHNKQALRIRYVNNVPVHDDFDVMVTHGAISQKWELARTGKVPRMVVDLNAGSMYANELPEFVKVCTHGERVVHYKGVMFILHTQSKPKLTSISFIFNRLIEISSMRNSVYLVNFSDDNCQSGNVGGKAFCYNSDAVAQDSRNRSFIISVTHAQFAMFCESTGSGKISQCMLPWRVVNPSSRGEMFEVEFFEPKQPTGIDSTTTINNTAAEAMKSGFMYMIANGFKPDLSLRMAYALCGHECTYEDCMHDGILVPEKVCFLKYFPGMTTQGKWVAQRCFGSIFRSLGMTKIGDLTADQIGLASGSFEFRTMSNETRMEHYISAIIRGYCHEPRSSIMTALRNRFNVGTYVIKPDWAALDGFNKDKTPVFTFEDSAIDNSDFDLLDSSICVRYNISQCDIDLLVDQVVRLVLGSVMSSEACAQFYFVDYGLPRED